jgi:hypothetical protein
LASQLFRIPDLPQHMLQPIFAMKRAPVPTFERAEIGESGFQGQPFGVASEYSRNNGIDDAIRTLLSEAPSGHSATGSSWPPSAPAQSRPRRR